MAAWQFAVNPIPASAAKIDGIDAIHLDRDARNEGGLHLPHDQQSALFDAFAALLPEQLGWSKDMRIWGSTKGNDIQVFFEGADIKCIEFRLDVSYLALPLIDGMCALARRFDWVFLSETGAVIQPTREAVVRAAEHSLAQKFVRDPRSYFG